MGKSVRVESLLAEEPVNTGTPVDIESLIEGNVPEKKNIGSAAKALATAYAGDRLSDNFLTDFNLLPPARQGVSVAPGVLQRMGLDAPEDITDLESKLPNAFVFTSEGRKEQAKEIIDRVKAGAMTGEDGYKLLYALTGQQDLDKATKLAEFHNFATANPKTFEVESARERVKQDLEKTQRFKKLLNPLNRVIPGTPAADDQLINQEILNGDGEALGTYAQGRLSELSSKINRLEEEKSELEFKAARRKTALSTDEEKATISAINKQLNPLRQEFAQLNKSFMDLAVSQIGVPGDAKATADQYNKYFNTDKYNERQRFLSKDMKVPERELYLDDKLGHELLLKKNLVEQEALASYAEPKLKDFSLRMAKLQNDLSKAKTESEQNAIRAEMTNMVDLYRRDNALQKYAGLQDDYMKMVSSYVTLSNNYPEQRRRELSRAIGEQIYADLSPIERGTGTIFTEARIKAAAEKLGVDYDLVKDIDEREFATGGAVDAFYNGMIRKPAAQMDAFFVRQGRNISGWFWDMMGDTDEGQRQRDIATIFGANRLQRSEDETKISADATLFGAPTIIDRNKLSQTYLREIQNPTYNKDNNINVSSVLTTMGDISGQVMNYALMSKGIGGGLKGSLALGGVKMGSDVANRIGTFASGFMQTYEPNYQRAREFIADEDERNLFAMLQSAKTAAVELILPDYKIINKLTGAGATKAAAEQFVKMLQGKGASALSREAIAGFVKNTIKPYLGEIVDTVGKETLEEEIDLIGSSVADSFFGKDIDPDLSQQAVETAVITAIGTLPFALVGGYKNTSQLNKDALYQAGLFPDFFTSKVNELRDQKKISDIDANQRIQTINTMDKIVEEIFTNSPVTGRKLSAQDKVNLAYNRLQEARLTQQISNTSDEVTKEQLGKQVTELQNERKEIIEQPVDEIKKPVVETPGSNASPGEGVTSMRNESTQTLNPQEQEIINDLLNDQNLQQQAPTNGMIKAVLDWAADPAKQADVIQTLKDQAANTNQFIDFFGEPLLEKIRSLQTTPNASTISQPLQNEEVPAQSGVSSDQQASTGEQEQAQIQTPLQSPDNSNRTFPGRPLTQTEQQESQKVGEPVKAKYAAAPRVYGFESKPVTRTLPDGSKIQGRFVLTTADAVTPSHDPASFSTSEGYPLLEDGRNPNDRDYTLPENQAAVVSIANNFNAQALDEMPIVDRNGVVLDGNNRTMSGQLAARQNTDADYLNALREQAFRFGFTPEQIEEVSKSGSPRVYIETEEVLPYDTNTFARFNRQTKKEKSPVARAIELGRTVSPNVISAVSAQLEKFDELSQFYGSAPAVRNTFRALTDSGVLLQTELPRYYNASTGTITASGKEFLESLLIGNVVGEDEMSLLTKEGVKRYREKIIKNLKTLTEIKALKPEFQIDSFLNEAIRIKDRLVNGNLTLDDYVRQQTMFGERLNPYAVAMHYYMESDAKTLKNILGTYLDRARTASAGGMDMFSSTVDTQQDILSQLTNKILNDEQRRNINTAASQRPPISGSAGPNIAGQQPGAPGSAIPNPANSPTTGRPADTTSLSEIIRRTKPGIEGVAEDEVNYVSESRNTQLKINFDAQPNVQTYQPQAEGPAISYQAASNFQPGEGAQASPFNGLPALRPGEFATVERQYVESNYFDFYSRTNKIESAEDVAFIFRQLENETVEHSFIVYVDEAGKPTIQHLSMGDIASALVDTRLIGDGLRRYNAKEVYFVHNHPSGNLKPSTADKQMFIRMQSALGPNIKLNDGIIVNLRGGAYATFDEASDIDFDAPADAPGQRVQVHTFSKQVFIERPGMPPGRVISSEDVARFISGQKFSFGDKFGMLVLATDGTIRGNFFLDGPLYTWEDVDRMRSDIHYNVSRYGGARFVMYGNAPVGDNNQFDFIREIYRALNTGGIAMLDYVAVKPDQAAYDFYNSYTSAADEGRLSEEGQAYYGDTPIVNDSGTSYNFGVPNDVLNNAIETMANAVQNGASLNDAIDQGVQFINDQMTTPWNEGAFRAKYSAIGGSSGQAAPNPPNQGAPNTGQQAPPQPPPGGQGGGTGTGGPGATGPQAGGAGGQRQYNINLDKLGRRQALTEWLKRKQAEWFKVGEGIDKTIRDLKDTEIGKVNEWATQIRYHQRDFNEVAKEAFGVKKGLGTYIPPDKKELMNRALTGDQAAMNQLPAAVQAGVTRLRNFIDTLTNQLINQGVIPSSQVAAANLQIAQQQGAPQGTLDRLQQELDLALFVEGRIGSYINRQYEKFYNKDYVDKVRKDPNKIQAAANYIYNQGALKGQNLSDDEITNIIRGILDSDSVDAFFQRANSLSLNNSVMKHLQDIPPEIRDLMGEVTDPEWNFVNTTVKMAGLLERHKFLNDLYNYGNGTYFHSQPDPAQNITAEITNPLWGPLRGTYTTPELKQALEDWDRVEADNSWAVNALRQVTSWTKATKTSLSWVSEIKNILGNNVLLLQNGNFTPSKLKDGFIAIKEILGKVDSPQGRDFVKRMARLNIINGSISRAELLGVTQNMVEVMPTGNAWDSTALTRFGRGLQNVKRKLGEIYGATDDVFKIITFLNERTKLEEAYQKSNVPKTSDELDKEAADISLRIMPTFAKVPKFIKGMAVHLPFFGNFMSYPTELLRTTANSVSLAIEQMRSTNPEIKKLGAKRLAWFMGSASFFSAIPALTSYLFSTMGGGTDDEERQGIYALLPEFYKEENANVFYKDGKYYVHLMSGLDGQSWLREIVNAGIRGEDPLDGAKDAVGKLLEPYANSNMVIAKIRQWDKNENQFGRPIYNPEDNQTAKQRAFVTHFKDLFVPQTFNDLYKPIEKYAKGEDTRGNLGVLKFLSGQTVLEINPGEQVKYKMQDFKNRLREAGKIKDPLREQEAKARILEEQRSFQEKISKLRFK